MTNDGYAWLQAEPPEPTLEELGKVIERLKLEKQIMELKLEIEQIHQKILTLTQPTITWTGNYDAK